MKEAYMEFIKENIDEIDRLQEEISYWQKIYSHRIFDKDWPKSIKEIINMLKMQIKEELEECQYYMTRIKEIKDDKAGMRQPLENEGNAQGAGVSTGDTDKDSAGVKP